VQVICRLGAVVVALGDVEGGMRELRRGLALCPELEQSADAHLDMAVRLLARSNSNAMIIWIYELTDRHHHTALNNGKIALETVKSFSFAEDEYRTAIHAEPARPEPHRRLAGLLADKPGKYWYDADNDNRRTAQYSSILNLARSDAGVGRR